MKTIERVIFQGDVCIKRVRSVPKKFKRVDRDGPVVVCHSESGHNHQIDDSGVVMFEEPSNPLVAYLRLDGVDHCDVVHKRSWDQHETVRLDGGPGSIFKVTRQREYTPAGWRRVAD